MAVSDGSGTPQLPNLFDGYAVRPTWDVAGVDYHVGITPGTVLRPITSIDVPGVTLDETNHLVRITGQDVVIDGYDFSGWTLYVQGQNVTIQNCYSNDVSGVGITGRNDGMYDGVDYTSSNLTIRNCEIDGTGQEFESQWSFINVTGTGTTTIENNYFHDAPTHVFEFAGTSTLLYRYNLEEDIGIDPTGEGPSNHVNFTQMLGGQSVNSQIVYNTMVQNSQPAGGQMIQVTGSNALVANNTLIANPRDSGEASISHMIDPGHAGDYFDGTIRDNYVDASGAYDLFYPSATGSNVSVSGNINLVTGSVINSDNSESTAPIGTRPPAPRLDGISNDSGTAGAHITNDNTLALTGSAVANSTVTVLDGTIQIGTTTANSSGGWNYTTGALGNGDHSLTATATTASGTSTASSALAVRIDTTAPNAPAFADDTVNANNTVALNGTAEANSTIKVFEGSLLLGTAVVNGSGAWSVTTTPLSSGSHSLTATATDVAGNVSASSQHSDPIAVSGSSSGSPPMSGWPDASNTGVPAGVTLTPSGGMIINTPGAVISGLDIRGTVYINAPNVTLENCRITSGDFYVVSVNAGITGAVIRDCDIIGSGVATNGNNGIGGQGTFLRNDISRVDNGIVVQGDSTLIQDNYIHDMQAASAHYDGIQIDGGISNATIRHNTIINDYDQTSAVMIDNWFGPVSNVIIDNNRLSGGGYTLYSDGQFSGGPITGVSFTNNQLGEGRWGYTYFVNNTPVWQGNTNIGTGQSVGASNTISMDGAEITSISVDSGVAGDHITSDNVLDLQGTAPVFATVRVYDGDTLIGTATADSTNKWSLTTPRLTDGNHSLTITATNGSETTAPPAPMAVRVDTVAPTAPTIATPTNNANGGLNLTGTAEANSSVQVFDGSAAIGTATTNSSGVWSYTTGALAAGSHILTARATDAAGNTGPASTVVTATTGSAPPSTLPTAPNINSFSNDSGAAGDGITNDNTLTLAGTAAANSTVKVFDGGNLIGTVTANGSGTWSYTTGVLSNGNHNLTATATNASGTSTASSALAVRVDTAAPTAPTIATPTNNANGGLNLTGTAEANSVVAVYDGTTQIGTATTNGSGVWGYTTGALATGSHSLTARATDAAGNTGAASAAVTASIGGTTPTAPAAPRIVSISNDSGIAGDGITNDSTLTLAGTAAAYGTVNVYDGTTQIGTATANSSGAWSYTTTALADGNHSLTATVTNSSGQTSSASSATAVRVDTAAPTAPHITSYTPDGGATADSATLTRAVATDSAAGDQLTLNGSAEANSTVHVFDGTTQIGTTTTNGSGAWSYAASNLADGTHSFTSRAVDSAGNTSASSTALSVNVHTGTNTEAPGVEFASVWQNWTDRVVFRGATDPNAQVSIYDNGGTSPVATVTAGEDGGFRVTTTSRLSDDVVHRFTATVTDGSGQAEPVSGSVVLGTRGDDRLTSTSGNDLFRGSGGHDTFEFAANFGNDVIVDFGAGRRGHDVVEFSRTVFDDFASVLAHATQNGQDVAIDAGAGNTLMLQNTSLSSLDRTDFHFV
jgi:hypothetical protein